MYLLGMHGWYDQCVHFSACILNKMKKCTSICFHKIVLSKTIFSNLILTVNKTKNFWLLSPTQLLTQGQWWSIFLIHLWQTLKRITKMSKIYQLVFVLLNLLEIVTALHKSNFFYFKIYLEWYEIVGGF